jgi:FAD/FMN-containing dehydrogenase
LTIVESPGKHPRYDEIKGIVGEARVNDNPLIISAYSQDACHIIAERPGIVVMPKNLEEIRSIVKLCSCLTR